VRIKLLKKIRNRFDISYSYPDRKWRLVNKLTNQVIGIKLTGLAVMRMASELKIYGLVQMFTSNISKRTYKLYEQEGN